MSYNRMKVRTLRPHDTSDGLRAPNEEYERSAAEAQLLADKGVVEIVATPKARAKKAK